MHRDWSILKFIPNAFGSQIDITTLQLTPVLAKALPELKVVGDNMEITLELRSEARWDNGSPVTSADVVYSLKAVKCPGVNSDAIRIEFDNVTDIKTYPENSRKLIFVCNEVHMLAEHVVGYELTIIPEYMTDPQKILRNFNVSNFFDTSESLTPQNF